MQRAWCVIGVAAALMRALPAIAEPEPPVHLVYDAPAGCPDAAAFERAVLQRTPATRLSTDATRTFTIRIAAGADGFTGTLTTGDAGAPRALSAARCDDLVGALALITALAIDPTAMFADAPTAPAAPVAPVPSRVEEPRPPAPPPPMPSRWFGTAIAVGELDLGVTPDAMPAGEVEARLHRRGLGHLDLAAIYGRDTASSAAGTARFDWRIGRASACWTPRDGRLALDACAHLEAGLLEARGVDVVRAQDLTRSWLAVGAHAAARWPAETRVFAELRVGASVPLVRDRFYFSPNVLIHQAAPVTPWVTIGVGVRFW